MKAYTTEEISQIMDMSERGEGDRRTKEILYRGMNGVKKGNLAFSLSREEILEYGRCTMDPIHFFETHCKIRTPQGLAHPLPRDYQRDLIRNYYDHRFNLVATSRQSGLTTMIALLAIHDLVFGTEKNLAIVTPDHSDVMEMIRIIYINLPFYIKPGVLKWREDRLVFDNGCTVIAKNRGKKIIGANRSTIFIDGFSHIKENENLLNLILPSASANRETKLHISSLPNGDDLFHDLLINAERKDGDPKKNQFIPQRIYWWEVPGRDANWKSQMVEMLGSEESFDREFDLSFKERSRK